MKIFGHEITSRYAIDTVNIASGLLGGYFVVYPIVTHAAETGRDKLPGFTKGIIDNVVAPVVKTTTSLVSPLLPLLAKVGLVAFIGFAAKEYYDRADTDFYRNQNPLGNLWNLSYNTGLRMKHHGCEALRQMQDSSYAQAFQAKFKQLPFPSLKNLTERLQTLFYKAPTTKTTSTHESAPLSSTTTPSSDDDKNRQ